MAFLDAPTGATHRADRGEIGRFLDSVTAIGGDGAAWAARQNFACRPRLSAGEAAYLARCHPRRRLEFRAGRDCALTALARIEAPAEALGRDSEGLPAWPRGTLGSISHSKGLCIALVSRSARLLGCDTEPNVSLPDGMRDLVIDGAERAEHAALDLPDRLWFCAKEAVFKALYPRIQIRFGFCDVQLSMAPASRRFVARLSPWLSARSGLHHLSGRFLLTCSAMLSAVFWSTDAD